MAFKKTFTAGESPLDFNQVLFQQMNRIMSEKDDVEYIKLVEKFTDLLWFYAKNDETTYEKLKDMKIRPRSVNPYDKSTPINKLVDEARIKFRMMMEVIHTTGSIMPIKSIEGVIDESVIDAVHESTGQLDD